MSQLMNREYITMDNFNDRRDLIGHISLSIILNQQQKNVDDAYLNPWRPPNGSVHRYAMGTHFTFTNYADQWVTPHIAIF